MKTLEFIECDPCRAKPGSPVLCQACIHNRTVIDELKRQKNATQEVVTIIRREGIPSMMILKNGHVEYFKLKPATYQDHLEMHGADKNV